VQHHVRPELPADERPPTFFVCGAFGAGKSVTALLAADLLPECLVVDVDWLLEPLSRLAGRQLTEDPESWPRLRDFWLVLASIAARAGRSTVIFSPEEPSRIEGLPSRGLLGDLHWLLLDCSAEEIRARLSRRPNWEPAWTKEALTDAARLRTLGLPSIRTDTLLPREVAGAVASWVRRIIAGGAGDGAPARPAGNGD
jgi:hypothetical protein